MQMVVERQEADHAMSWLSTLGGAFSALGEEFEHCVSCSWLFCLIIQYAFVNPMYLVHRLKWQVKSQ